MQIPILNGVYADSAPDWRTSYPRNMVPAPKQTGISQGYLRPADGIVSFASGPGADRGGILWNGVMYRVMGTKLCSVSSAGAVTVLGDVGGTGQVTLDYGFDRLAIASGGRLYYWNGSTLSQVTDPDLGTVVDALWVAGYYMTTDGASLVVTELNDSMAVNPTKYGSAESDPDPIMAVHELRNEVYAVGRYTTEVFQNVGGDGFPFSRIEEAQVSRGAVGTYAVCEFMGTFAFVGGARNEPAAVWLMLPGDSGKISTREIDQVLKGYTEAELASTVCEARTHDGHMELRVHLPDQCWVYDGAASKVIGEPAWYSLDSGLGDPATYRARNLVWAYGKWLSGDPTASSVGELVNTQSHHYGAKVGWSFGALMVYNEGAGAIVHDLELITLPGRVALGVDPTIWTSYSLDGETWSRERPKSAGKQGQRGKRIAWRDNGDMQLYRTQRFRGTSDAHLSITRLEAQIEPLINGAFSG